MTTSSDKENHNRGEKGGSNSSSMSSSSSTSSSSSGNGNSVPPSGVIVPGGPNGPDGTIIEEVMTTVVGKKQPVRGQAFRATNGEYVSYLCTDDEALYRPGDAVYIESQRADQPFFICSIQEFRRSKRDNLMVNIKWFYRPSEVPETVYQLLVQDRNTENNNKSLAIDDPVIKSRELFISDATDTYPVSVLRGVCRVDHHADIHAVRDFTPDDNSFFYILGYNPETRRLASTQGEIRIGPSHQAKLPDFKGNLKINERPEKCIDWEERRWIPGASRDTDLLMYLRAARSMAAFAGLCDGGSTMDGCNAASRDDTTISALDILHSSDYDHGKALQSLVKCPVPEGVEKKWAEEDTKRFIKGLRLYGKNFFRIRKELLQHKETSDLVSYYYLWKKTPAAAGHRPHRRHRRQNVLRRIRTPRATRNTGPSDPLDPSSASENEDDSDDSDSKDRQGYHCRNCFTTSSRDWHHAGKEKQLLCYDCRVNFKRYGDLPIIKTPRGPPPPATTPKPQQPEEDTGIRTRTRAKELNTRHRVARRSRANTPDTNDDNSDRRTPDRRTPDRRNIRSSGSPAPKKVIDEKLNSGLTKRPRVPEDASQTVSTPNKKKKNGTLNTSDISSEESSEEDTCEIGLSSPMEAFKSSAASSRASCSPPPAGSFITKSSANLSTTLLSSNPVTLSSQLSTNAACISTSNCTNIVSESVSNMQQTQQTGSCSVNSSVNLLSSNGPLPAGFSPIIIRQNQPAYQESNREISTVIECSENSKVQLTTLTNTVPSVSLACTSSSLSLQSIKATVAGPFMTVCCPSSISSPALSGSPIRIQSHSVTTPIVSELCVVPATIAQSLPVTVNPNFEGNIRGQLTSNSFITVSTSVPILPPISTIAANPSAPFHTTASLLSSQIVHTLSAPIVHTLPITANQSSPISTSVMSNSFASLSSVSQPAVTIPVNSSNISTLSHPANHNSALLPPIQSSASLSLSSSGMNTQPSTVLPIHLSSHISAISLNPHPSVLHSFSSASNASHTSADAIITSSASQYTQPLSLISGIITSAPPINHNSNHISVTIPHVVHTTATPPPAHPSSILLSSTHPASSLPPPPAHPVKVPPPPPAHPSNGPPPSAHPSMTLPPPAHPSAPPQPPPAHLPPGHVSSSQSHPTATLVIQSSPGPPPAHPSSSLPPYLISNMVTHLTTATCNSIPLANTSLTSVPSPLRPSVLPTHSLMPPLAHASSFPTAHSSVIPEHLTLPIYGTIPPPAAHSLPQTPRSSVPILSYLTPNSPPSCSEVPPPSSTTSPYSGILNPLVGYPVMPSKSSVPGNIPSSLIGSHSTAAVTSSSITFGNASPQQSKCGVNPIPSHSNIQSVQGLLAPPHSGASIPSNLLIQSPTSSSSDLSQISESLHSGMIHVAHLSNRSEADLINQLPHPYGRFPIATEGAPRLHPHSSSTISSPSQKALIRPSPSPPPVKSPFLPSSYPHSMLPANLLKVDQIKKEPDTPLRLDKPKGEVLESVMRSDPKEDLRYDVKREIKLEPNAEIKIEKNDRPEIIAEIKVEQRGPSNSHSSSFPPPHPLAINSSSDSIIGNLPQAMGMPGYPYGYPYPYHPLHHPYASAQRLSMPRSSSPSNLSPVSTLSQSVAQFRKSPSPSQCIPTSLCQAPPAHLGPPIFPGRAGGSGLPTPLKGTSSRTTASPSHPSKSPGLAIPKASPGLTPANMALSPLLTPPAAHTGPVRPPSGSSLPAHQLSLPQNSSQPPSFSSLHHHAQPPHSSPHIQVQPPTTQALPPTVAPSHQGFPQPGGPSGSSGNHEGDDHDDDDDIPPHREPSPEPKLEDSECHRSQSAIFLRHWNRGDFNSCARTDLTFKPVPDSKLARKREERARRQAEREREEREKAQRKASTPDKRETPKSVVNVSEPSMNSNMYYDRMLPRVSEASVLSRLGHPSSSMRPPSLGLHPSMGGGHPQHQMDPILHYSMAGLYGVGARERMEMERDREMRERDLNDRIKEEMMKQRSPLEHPPPYAVGLSPHLLGAARYAGIPHTSIPSGFPPPSFYASPSHASTATLLAVERDRYERFAAATAFAAGYPRPTMLRPGDPHAHLPPGYAPHAAALLGRPYEEQFAQLAAHDQLQRHLMMERERLTHLNQASHFRPPQ